MIARISLTALFVGSVALASATDMTITGLDFGSSTDTITISDSALGIHNLSVYAGPFDSVLNSNGSITNPEVFCADLSTETVYNKPYSVSVETTTTLSSAYESAAKYYNYFDGRVGSSVLDNAALQVAIWKALYGSSFSFDTSSSVGQLAETYINTNVSSASNSADFYNFNGCNQNMLGGNGHSQAVPEPCSMIALGLGAIGLVRRRKSA